MSAIENPLSLLSFDQPSSIAAVPIVPSYATANKIPVPLVDGIASSFKSPNVALPNSLASIVNNGMTPPPSYHESSLYAAGGDPGLNAQGLPIIHILSKQPLPRSQWVGTSHVSSLPITDLKPFLSDGVNWKKIVIVLLIILMVFFIIFVLHLLWRDSKRCNKATTLGTSRNKSKLSGKVETSAAAVTSGSSLLHGGPPFSGTTTSPITGLAGSSTKTAGFSRLLRPGPQVQASSAPRPPGSQQSEEEEETSRRATVQASRSAQMVV